MVWTDIKASFWSEMKFALVSSDTSLSFFLVRSGLHSSSFCGYQELFFLMENIVDLSEGTGFGPGAGM